MFTDAAMRPFGARDAAACFLVQMMLLPKPAPIEGFAACPKQGHWTPAARLRLEVRGRRCVRDIRAMPKHSRQEWSDTADPLDEVWSEAIKFGLHRTASPRYGELLRVRSDRGDAWREAGAACRRMHWLFHILLNK